MTMSGVRSPRSSRASAPLEGGTDHPPQAPLFDDHSHDSQHIAVIINEIKIHSVTSMDCLGISKEKTAPSPAFSTVRRPPSSCSHQVDDQGEAPGRGSPPRFQS